MNFLKYHSYLLLLLFWFSCGEGPQQQQVEINAPEENEQQKEEDVEFSDFTFEDDLIGAAFNYYLQVRTALFNGDADEAAEAAENLAEILGDKMLETKNLALKITDSNDLEDQRLAFSELSEDIEPFFKEKLLEGNIYKQYCPMAFSNEGAYWFSEIKEVQNPYFGEKMPNCGRIEETINPKN